ncbi:uncharacterized protein EV422DRAFT_615182 [Fimicolochytrium jonesii]|uniref:uncharacterized protein n=1 Tax=Fimicolochytrium jonesii TaxID=1396493 RepID=UPI0022FEF89E|nr:uncharacterized protein EV422DRAFT_615182 [Fimicolochytrium jonesii]KAI8821781.1 hypothetical protein EV422DRAFT_615182 [Fimicolochytrium jonesii]
MSHSEHSPDVHASFPSSQRLSASSVPPFFSTRGTGTYGETDIRSEDALKQAKLEKELQQHFRAASPHNSGLGLGGPRARLALGLEVLRPISRSVKAVCDRLFPYALVDTHLSRTLPYAYEDRSQLDRTAPPLFLVETDFHNVACFFAPVAFDPPTDMITFTPITVILGEKTITGLACDREEVDVLIEDGGPQAVDFVGWKAFGGRSGTNASGRPTRGKRFDSSLSGFSTAIQKHQNDRKQKDSADAAHAIIGYKELLMLTITLPYDEPMYMQAFECTILDFDDPNAAFRMRALSYKIDRIHVTLSWLLTGINPLYGALLHHQLRFQTRPFENLKSMMEFLKPHMMYRFLITGSNPWDPEPQAKGTKRKRNAKDGKAFTASGAGKSSSTAKTQKPPPQPPPSSKRAPRSAKKVTR